MIWKLKQVAVRKLIAVGLMASASVSLGYSSSAAEEVRSVTEGQLTVLMTSASPPTNFIQDGKPAGMAIDIIDEVARRIGLDTSYKAISDYAGIIPAISNNQYDIAAVGMMRTPKRLEIVDFTSPWYYGWFPLLARSESGFGGYDDLEGLSVGVVNGSIQQAYMADNYPGIRLTAFPNDIAIVAALNAGSVDAALTGNALLKTNLERFPNLEVIAKTPVPYPNAFPMSKDNPELLEAVNTAMIEIMNDGTYVEFYDRWHEGDPLPDPLYDDFPDLAKHRAKGATSSDN